jgi:hypothetical protein
MGAHSAADHGAAGATVDVGLTNGKGMGIFIYRNSPGHGPLDLTGMTLRSLGHRGPDAVSLIRERRILGGGQKALFNPVFASFFTNER